MVDRTGLEPVFQVSSPVLPCFTVIFVLPVQCIVLFDALWVLAMLLP